MLRSLRRAFLASVVMLVAGPIVPVAPSAQAVAADGARAVRAAPRSSERDAVQDAGAIVVESQGLRLSSTFSSVGIELRFSGDENGDASASLELKKSSDDTWRSALPLWRTSDGSASPGPAFYGSALFLEAGTQYDVRVTLRDPDGVVGPQVVTASAATRAEDIPAVETLVPTHFVQADGSDAGDGLSRSTAWRSLEKAVTAAPPNAVVLVGPGYFGPPVSPRTTPITLLAEYPAVDDGRNQINIGRRTVIEPAVASPRGSADVNPGAWQRVTLSGPSTGQQYSIWKWASSGVAAPTQLGVASSRSDTPVRVAHWKKGGADLQTPAGWVEKLYTNQGYNFGFYADGQDIYLRLSGDRDPNELYVTAGKGSGLALSGPHIRVSGFEVRQFEYGIYFDEKAAFGVVDHSLLTGNLHGVHFHASQRAPITYGGDHVIQYNLILDGNLWSEDQATSPSIPWGFVKLSIKNSDGTNYAVNRLGEMSESSGIGGRGGANRVVVRYNTIDGTFNGVNGGFNNGFDRYAGSNKDVYGNLIRHIADDALEPDNFDINFRAWDNRVENASVFMSLGPAQYGPVYVIHNEAWRLGNHGVAQLAGDSRREPGTVVFKYSGSSVPQARVYVVNNTFWTDRGPANGSGVVSGGAQIAGGGPNSEAFYLRNNIFRMTGYAFAAPMSAGAWDEDFNYFSTVDETRGLRLGSNFTTRVAAYRTASGQGSHSNTSASFVVSPQLADPEAGDLSLPEGSPLIDAGMQIPNVSDVPGRWFAGSAPDIGARER